MYIFEITSVPIGQILDPVNFATRVGGLFLDWEFPVRLIAMTQQFDLDDVIRRTDANVRPLEQKLHRIRPLIIAIQHHLDGLDPTDPYQTWRDLDRTVQDEIATLLDAESMHALERGSITAVQWAAISDQLRESIWQLAPLYDRREYFAKLGHSVLRSVRYYLLVYPPDTIIVEQLQSSISRAFRSPAQLVAQLPAVIRCDYQRTTRLRLEPTELGEPYISIQTMHDMRGHLYLHTLHTLLSMPFDLAIAIDIQTLNRNAARREVHLAYAAASAAVQYGKSKDTHSEEKLADTQAVMQTLHTQSLHDVWLSVLVTGRDADDLAVHIADVRGALGNACRLTALPNQAELLKLFSTQPRNQIALPPALSRNLLTNGLGYLAGLTTFHVPHNTQGIFWGIDLTHRAPLFADLFANNQAGHGAVFGETGSGKTVFLNRLTLEAALDGHRVVWVDAFKNAYTLQRAIGVGCRVDSLSAQQVINPLDVVYADEPGQLAGMWRSKQIPHVIDVLSHLTGRQGFDGAQQYSIPAEFSPEEEGILSAVLGTLYARVEPDDPLETMPTLLDLLALLDDRSEIEAQHFARRLRLKFTGSEESHGMTQLNEEGRWFIGTTTVDFDLSTDITCFDLFDTPERYRVLYTLWLIGALLRYMRDPNRDVSRKTFLFLDEFHILARVQSLMAMTKEIVKVARKYGVALILADQNPSTLLASDTGRQIAENMKCLFLFRMKPIGARQILDLVDGMHEGHIAQIADAEPGQCIAVIQRTLYDMYVPLSPLQAQMLIGK